MKDITWTNYVGFEEVQMSPMNAAVASEHLDKDLNAGMDAGYLVKSEDGDTFWSPAESAEASFIIQRHEPSSPIMAFFSYKHLPKHLQPLSRLVCLLATAMDSMLPNCVEKSTGLRKLLEAKDCFVRA